MDHEETLLTISAMRRQEESEYFCCDYFYLDACRSDDNDNNVNDPSTTDSHGNSTAPCDPMCRQIMFYWMIRVVDFFPSMNRETVAYAMSYLDRFLQSNAGTEARRKRGIFQLAAISCLYTSVKIHEHAAVSPKFLEQLSRDEYTVRDVERMELTILKALKWRLATPTSLTFLRQYMELIPSVLLDDDVRSTVYDMAKFQTEVALGDYKYVTVNNSIIAYCSLMNALESLRVNSRMSIGWFVSEAAHLEQQDSIYTQEIQRSLALDHADHAGLNNNNNSKSSSSPVSVGYDNTNNVNNKATGNRKDCGGQFHHNGNDNSSPRTVTCKTS